MLAGKEKRHFDRQQALLNVRIFNEKKASVEPLLDDCIGETINLSGGGMYLKVKESMNVDEVVQLRFLPPNTFDLFRGAGRVVRADQNADQTFNVAVEFIDIPDSEKKLLDYYLHR